ncbi:uncharacterized protein LOC116294573 isoform X2 [Actinia tenebrosa]|uniref:Uncharacterized protein LOC116294573 isoform X2 n=1 Tax=Actinia tenebrosa TaxID=6105 RepID=A0A6P8HSB7_ACTTE|nr:uncharacterized protein LOC116294573 isoform X2 [Actinia tenebrosa]
MDQIILAIIAVIIFIVAWFQLRNPENNQNKERPRGKGKIVKQKATRERQGRNLDLEWQKLQRLGLLELQGGHLLRESRIPRTRDGKITLYHYTTDRGARGIQRDGLIKSSDENTQPQHRKYGSGVYFTSYSPHDLEPDKLALNCFTHRGTVVTSPGIYSRTRYVVEIKFYENEVQKLNILNRDVYIFRGSIHLRHYEGRYRIYKNPKHPYDPRYSFYIDSFGY